MEGYTPKVIETEEDIDELDIQERGSVEPNEERAVFHTDGSLRGIDIDNG